MSTSSPPPKRVRGFEKNRLEALIDGIFAVALTLLVLDIKLPDTQAFATNDALWRRLLELERHFAIYVISFVVIGMYWISHHIQFHFVRYTDRALIWIDLFYLLLISFVPFATDLMGDHKDLVLPCEIYGVTLLGLSALSFLHLEYLSRHPYLTTAELTPEIVRLIKHRILLFMLIPLTSMVIAFYSTHIALYTYMLLVLAHFSTGPVDEHVHTQPASDAGPEN
ncbi:MAG: TMEM175 family protein [Betaproteobacteria bacterium]